MKNWAWMILAVPVLISLAGGQTSESFGFAGSGATGQGTWHPASPEDRMFFPRDMDSSSSCSRLLPFTYAWSARIRLTTPRRTSSKS